ncbi:MAG: methyltransferase [Candidatus Dependentiae bacterium]
MSIWRLFALVCIFFVMSITFYCYFYYGDCIFFGRFLWQPKQTGSIMPTSRIAATELIQPMLAKDGPRNILEVGAGTGPVTEVVAEHLRPEDKFDVLELDDVLCDLLRDKFSAYEQLDIHCVPIEQWDPGYQYDVIISTVPLTNLNSEQIQPILHQFEQLAKSNGVISYLEYIGGMQLKQLVATEEQKIEMQKKEQLFDTFKNKHKTDTVSVLVNVPPTYVHHVNMLK